MKRIGILFILAIMVGVFVQCEREGVREEVGRSSGETFKEFDHEYPEGVCELTDNTLEPIVSGIKKYEDMLWFGDEAFFCEVMSRLVNHEEGVLDSWECSLGFSSLRSYYNTMELSEEIDDADLDLERIPDRAFESVLNRNGEVRIGDSIYRVDNKNNIVYSWHYSDSSKINTYRISGFGDWTNHQTYCSRVINGGKNRIKGTKWVRNFLFYGSVGARTNYYKKNWRGKWKKAKASEIHLLLDQWSYLKYFIENGPPPCNDPILLCIETNYNKGKTKAKKVEHVFRIAQPISKIHVVEFGRIHHWTTNYNEDCHTEAW